MATDTAELLNTAEQLERQRELLVRAARLPNAPLPVDTRVLIPGIGLGNLIGSEQKKKITKSQSSVLKRGWHSVWEHDIAFDLVPGPSLPIMAIHELGAAGWAKLVVPDATRTITAQVFPAPELHKIQLRAGMTVGDLLGELAAVTGLQPHCLRLSDESGGLVDPPAPYRTLLSAVGEQEDSMPAMSN